MDPYELKVGQRLTLPKKVPCSAARRSGGASVGESANVYVVKKGDILELLVRRCGALRWQEIARANDIADPADLRVGQKLTIPVVAQFRLPSPRTATPVSRDVLKALVEVVRIYD